MRTVIFALASLAGLGACALVVDFDGYRPPASAAPVVLEAGPSAPEGDFTLSVPEAVRLPPGAAVRVPVTVARGPGTPERIVVTVDPSSAPEGVTWSAEGAIDVGATTTNLVFTAAASAPPAAYEVKVIATGGSITHSAVFGLAVRGASCTLDLPFAPDRTGMFTVLSKDSITDLHAVPGYGPALVISTDVPARIYAFGSDALLSWFASPNVQINDLEADDVGAWFAHPSFVGHVTQGLVDAQIPMPCLEVVVGRAGGAICQTTNQNHWDAILFTRDGTISGRPSCFFAAGDDAVVAAATAMGTDLVGCGTVYRPVDEAHAAFARWSRATNELDRTFGVAGRVLRDETSVVFACNADDKGIVATGLSRGRNVLMGIRPNGTIDDTFGDADGLAELPHSASQIIFDVDGMYALGATKLFRFSRAGKIDAAFGNTGQCAVETLGLTALFGFLPLSAERGLVLGTAPDRTLRLARVWL